MTTTLDKLDTINDSLNDIKTAVIAKGQVPSGDITTYATAINNITQTNNTTLSVTPTTSAQNFTPSSPYTGYSMVDVGAVTASIDNNITAGNIKSGVSILGVSGNITELKGETRTATLTSSAGNTFTPSSGKNAITSITVTPTNEARTVNPSTSSQSLTVNSGYSGNGTITVNPVTASIDANIIAENIKKDVQILGVTGSLESGGGGGDKESKMIANYVLKSSDGTNYTIEALTKNSNILNPKAVDIPTSKFLSIAYQNNTTIREVNLSSLESASGEACLRSAFSGCTSLTKVDLSSLETASGYQCLLTIFSGCTSLTKVDLSSLETASGEGCLQQTFKDCTSLLTLEFPKLSTLSGAYSLYALCEGCVNLTSISFPSLTTSSFPPNKYQISELLRSTGTTTTHTIHFPSNMQSTISSLSGYPTFGGTSGYVVLAFDLPATS